MRYKTILSTEDTLRELYDDNSLTIEGLAEESFGDFVNDMEKFMKDGIECVDVYHTTGEVMNSTYGLTGSNAYSEDLTIASIKLSNFKDEKIGALAMYRFMFGGRWFNDIVDNNARREREKK